MKKKILVIGATSSIAENCLTIWAERGNHLFLVARNKNGLKKLTLKLKSKGAGNIYTYNMNLNYFDNHSAMLNSAEAALKNIDVILVACGVLPNQKKCEKNIDQTIKDIKINALSVISLLTLIANRFEKKKSGIIAVLSSVAGDRGRASNYVYGSAKSMVTVFMSGLRQRLYKSNVTVLTIKPAYIDTRMTKHFKKNFLWTDAMVAAREIVKSIDLKKDEVYVPSLWYFLMKIINLIPNIIFKKLKM